MSCDTKTDGKSRLTRTREVLGEYSWSFYTGTPKTRFCCPTAVRYCLFHSPAARAGHGNIAAAAYHPERKPRSTDNKRPCARPPNEAHLWVSNKRGKYDIQLEMSAKTKKALCDADGCVQLFVRSEGAPPRVLFTCCLTNRSCWRFGDLLDAGHFHKRESKLRSIEGSSCTLCAQYTQAHANAGYQEKPCHVCMYTSCTSNMGRLAVGGQREVGVSLVHSTSSCTTTAACRISNV